MLFDLLKWKPSKLLGVCDSAVSSVLRRHPLETIIPCELQSCTHISQYISGTVEDKNTLFLSSLEATSESILSLLDVTDVLEMDACRRYTQRRKGESFLRLVGGGYWVIVDRFYPFQEICKPYLPKGCCRGGWAFGLRGVQCRTN